jgi:hypothetical protein
METVLKVEHCLFNETFAIIFFFIGQWSEDRACGFGVFIYNNGNKYEGAVFEYFDYK